MRCRIHDVVSILFSLVPYVSGSNLAFEMLTRRLRRSGSALHLNGSEWLKPVRLPLN